MLSGPLGPKIIPLGSTYSTVEIIRQRILAIKDFEKINLIITPYLVKGDFFFFRIA